MTSMSTRNNFEITGEFYNSSHTTTELDLPLNSQNHARITTETATPDLNQTSKTPLFFSFSDEKVTEYDPRTQPQMDIPFPTSPLTIFPHF